MRSSTGGTWRPDSSQLRRVVIQDRRHRVRRRVPLERALAGEHLVEDGAEAEDVGAAIDRTSAHLLGRHVACRPHHRANVGCRSDCGHRRQSRITCMPRRLLDGLGQTEVQDLYPAFAGYKNVVGLQIAMGDVFAVGSGQTVCHLHGVIDRFAVRKRSAGQTFAQAFAFQQLRDQERRTFVLTDVMHRQNVGMTERGDSSGFLLETPQTLGISGKRGRQYLESYIAPQTGVASAIHLSHAARSDKREDFVRSKFSARGQGHEVSAL